MAKKTPQGHHVHPVSSERDPFTAAVRAEYGSTLRRVVLYGSRARGEAEHDSDIDLLVVLDGVIDMRSERQRLRAVATRVSLEYEVVVSALPIDASEYETSSLPVIAAARHEGTVVG